MTEGWICPRCTLVLAPAVTEHRCDPPGTIHAWPTIWPAPTPGAATAPWPLTVTVTHPVTTCAGTATTGFIAATIPATAGSGILP